MAFEIIRRWVLKLGSFTLIQLIWVGKLKFEYTNFVQHYYNNLQCISLK